LGYKIAPGVGTQLIITSKKEELEDPKTLTLLSRV
jgi:hypothetical protein